MINVYLHAARLLGSQFTISQFRAPAGLPFRTFKNSAHLSVFASYRLTILALLQVYHFAIFAYLPALRFLFPI